MFNQEGSLPGSPSDAFKRIFLDIAKNLRPNSNTNLAEKLRTDKFLFARQVLGNEAVFPETLEGEWKKLFDFIFNNFSSVTRFAEVLSPRNTFKSTLLAAYIVYLIAMDRNVRILYVTNVHDNAILLSKGIQRQLESNQLLIEAFGTFKPENATEESGVWRQDYFFVSGRTTNAKEPTFTAASVGITKVGMHFDYVIGDDCVDKENTRTQEGIRGTIEWFKVLPPLLDKKSKYGPGGCLLNCGTRYMEGDLHGWLMGETNDNAAPHKLFKVICLKALENPECWDEQRAEFVNPQLNFPFVLTKPILDAERAINGPYWFATQYLNQTTTPDDALFKPHWFHLIPSYDAPPIHAMRKYLLTDYAFGIEEENDRTALWIVGLDWERKAYVLDFDCGRWGLHESVNRSIEYIIKYDVEKVGIEQVSLNEGIRSELERQRDYRRLKFKIEQIGGRSQETKLMRIVSMQPRFEGRRIFFVQRDVQDTIGVRPQWLKLSPAGKPCGEIYDEFIRFPRARHDDIPDALSDIDKIDGDKKTYFFPGASGFVQNWHPGPTQVNGKVLYTFGDPYGTQKAVESGSGGGNFWSRGANDIRSRSGYYRSK